MGVTNRLTLTVALALCGLLVGGALAQQTRRTHTGKLTFDELQYDFANNAITMTGDPATVLIEGRHTAHLRAPRVAIDADETLEQILGATAQGPVKLELFTAPDVNGRRRRIEATCTERATYSQADSTVVMTGNVVGDVTTLPEGEAEAAHLEAEEVVVNLRTSVMKARPGSFTVTTEADVPAGAEAGEEQ